MIKATYKYNLGDIVILKLFLPGHLVLGKIIDRGKSHLDEYLVKVGNDGLWIPENCIELAITKIKFYKK